jgi:hypothetical protein
MSRMPEVGPMQFARALDEAAGWLDERQPREPCVVAVDGHSAAGKSTFADALASRTGAALARGDDFYRVMDEAERAELARDHDVGRRTTSSASGLGNSCEMSIPSQPEAQGLGRRSDLRPDGASGRISA